jgi:phage nucleotide-binding protein
VKSVEIIQSEDLKRDSNFKMLLYAKPGTGKTSTVRYLKGKTLLLDIDHTSQVLSGLPGISVVRINPETVTKDIVEFFGYAKANIHEYDNVVIDNLSHYQKLWLMEKGKNTKSGQPELQHYGIFDSHLLNMISTFNSLDANIVYTSWENTRQIQLENGQLYNQFLPDIRDKVVNHVMGIIPVVGRLVKNPETNVRGFLLSESNGTFAKNQLDNREFSLQEDIFKVGETDVQTT